MVKHGAVLQDSSTLSAGICRQSINSGTLTALATFEGRREFIVDMFRAGAGFQLIAYCCNATATSSREVKYISLCQAAVLAGYVPSAEELQKLQLEAARDDEKGHLIQQLVKWLNEDKQVPSLLSITVHFQSILPALDKLPLPTNLKLYLQFDGVLSEVDLTVNKKLKTQETTEETDFDDFSFPRRRRRRRRRRLRVYNALFDDYY